MSTCLMKQSIDEKDSSYYLWLSFTPNRSTGIRISSGDGMEYAEPPNSQDIEYRHKKRSTAVLQPLLTLNLIL